MAFSLAENTQQLEAHGAKVLISPGGHVRVYTNGNVQKLRPLIEKVKTGLKESASPITIANQDELRGLLETIKSGGALPNGMVLMGPDKNRNVWSVGPENLGSSNHGDALNCIQGMNARKAYGCVNLQLLDLAGLSLVYDRGHEGLLKGTFKFKQWADGGSAVPRPEYFDFKTGAKGRAHKSEKLYFHVAALSGQLNLP